MEENSSSKVSMFFYVLKEGDVKEPLNKYNIIPRKLYFIGRSSKECEIVLDEKLLSRKHAELIYNNKKEIIVRDLNSRNGTFINKEKIEPDKDILFSINDVLSFGNTNNEIVFYDYTENKNKKEEDTDKEKSTNQKKYNSQEKNNNYQSSERNNNQNNYSRSRDTQKYFNNNERKNYSRKSNEKSYSHKNISRSRSRSQETQRHNSKKFSGLEDILKNLDKKNQDQNNNYNYNDRYNNRYDYYRNRPSYEREKERNNFKRDNNRYNYENNDIKQGYNNIKTIKDKFENKRDDNNNDNGFIKCYVSGYMMLKIRK